MVLNIFLDYFRSYFVANCANKVTIFPKFPSPQLPLHFSMSAKYLLRTYALHNPHYRTYRIFRGNTYKYMYVIFGYFHLNLASRLPQYL